MWHAVTKTLVIFQNWDLFFKFDFHFFIITDKLPSFLFQADTRWHMVSSFKTQLVPVQCRLLSFVFLQWLCLSKQNWKGYDHFSCRNGNSDFMIENCKSNVFVLFGESLDHLIMLTAWTYRVRINIKLPFKTNWRYAILIITYHYKTLCWKTLCWRNI